MMLKKNISKIIFYLAGIAVAFFLLLPFFWMVSTSFKEKGALMTIPIQWIPQEISFDAYRKLFTIFPFGRSILNSFFVAIVTTIIGVFSAAMAAYVFAKFDFKGKNIIFTLFLATMMIPGQVTTIPNYLVLKYLGLLNSFTGLILPSFFNAFGTFMLRQNFMTIPDSYLEAAIIDGASQFKIFWKVMVPLSKPILATLAVLSFMGSWNSYLWPLIILTDKKKMTLPVGLSLLNGQYGNHYNLLMAGSLISIIPILLFYLLAQRYFEKGITLGGIKG